MPPVRLALAALALSGALLQAATRPNIVWLTSEDHGPQMGCYGDPLATTPNVDALARRGLLYTRVWSCAPVCAPARTTLITGLHPTSTGSEHMRSMVPMPRGHRILPQLLRDAGYYTSNNAKEDYNIQPVGPAWHDSSRRAHWTNRPAGTPFFAVFNSEKSHESQIRRRPHTPVHDPARVRVPAYHPDTPEVRRDWAQYYDIVSEADAAAGARLRELESAGLLEDTIVFYFGDHGSGMPRSKRWPYNSGLHVPLVVYIPNQFADLRPPEYRPGGRSERLVSFVDFAPTVLSLAGVQPPAFMQGHAFLGRHAAGPAFHNHGFRGRMDERYDLVRSVTDGRFVYIRNYLPHLPYGQHIDYLWQTPTTRVWEQLHKAGKLTAAQDTFWNPKPHEELYDLESDPDEVRNLARDTAHLPVLARLRTAQREHARRIRDTGFIPEQDRHERAAGGSIHDLTHSASPDTRPPLEEIFAAAERASDPAVTDTAVFIAGLAHPDNAVRYWSIVGLQIRGAASAPAVRGRLEALLGHGGTDVRLAAARALAEADPAGAGANAIPLLFEHADPGRHGTFAALIALNALDALGGRLAPWAARVGSLSTNAPAAASGPALHARYGSYVPRLVLDLKERFP